MKVVVFDDVLHGRSPRPAVAGLELRYYENGDDAEAVIRHERPALVCMDYAMDARRSGAEVIAAVRAAQASGAFGDLPRLRIVAISADRDNNEAMLDAGADDAVPKTHLYGYLARAAAV